MGFNRATKTSDGRHSDWLQVSLGRYFKIRANSGPEEFDRQKFISQKELRFEIEPRIESGLPLRTAILTFEAAGWLAIAWLGSTNGSPQILRRVTSNPGMRWLDTALHSMETTTLAFRKPPLSNAILLSNAFGTINGGLRRAAALQGARFSMPRKMKCGNNCNE